MRVGRHLLDTGPNTTAGWRTPHIQGRLPMLVLYSAAPGRSLRFHIHNHC